MYLWLGVAILAVLVCIGMYLLYRHGVRVTKHIRAVLFIFQHKAADWVTLDSCTGWVRHAGRSHEDKADGFLFDAMRRCFCWTGTSGSY